MWATIQFSVQIHCQTIRYKKKRGIFFWNQFNSRIDLQIRPLCGHEIYTQSPGREKFSKLCFVFCFFLFLGEVFRTDVVNNSKKGHRKIKMKGIFHVDAYMINGISGRELFDSSRILSHFIDEFFCSVIVVID
jgi:hypothetical protein